MFLAKVDCYAVLIALSKLAVIVYKYSYASPVNGPSMKGCIPLEQIKASKSKA